MQFKLLGYGDISLQPRLQLCAGPPRTDATPLQLNCLPLELPCTLLLRPPPAVPAAAEFFRSWNTLSARAELAGAHSLHPCMHAPSHSTLRSCS